MLNSDRYTSWTQDRFLVFLVLATALHMLLFFGVNFGLKLKSVPRLADTLDVVLVQWRSEEEPDKADFLAQAAQQGGGETEEKQRPMEKVSSEVPVADEGQDMAQSDLEIPAPLEDHQEVVAVESEADPVLQQTQVEQPALERPTASQLMQQSMDMASLQPEINRKRQAASGSKRKKFISANTKEYEFASYMSAWVSKVERVGNLNYPSELRQKKLHGDLILMVGVRQNGTVDSIDVMRSSGTSEIDQAAIRIVQLAAPYAPLPDNISDRVDILYITRTWRFEAAFGVN